MLDEMGTFRVDVEIENPVRPGPRRTLFGAPGDLVLLGAHTLEGLNLRVEPVTKQLVDAGPAPAAACAEGPLLPCCGEGTAPRSPLPFMTYT